MRKHKAIINGIKYQAKRITIWHIIREDGEQIGPNFKDEQDALNYLKIHKEQCKVDV